MFDFLINTFKVSTMPDQESEKREIVIMLVGPNDRRLGAIPSAAHTSSIRFVMRFALASRVSYYSTFLQT